jgi:hypothetical protein
MPIILSKPGAISKKKQVELKEIGYVVIESDNPHEILVLDETPMVDGNILLSAALNALDYGGTANDLRMAFGDLIRKKMLAKTKAENKKEQQL